MMANRDPERKSLREYQQRLHQQIIDAHEAGINPLVVLSTGGGKTVIAAAVLETLMARGIPCVVLAHRQEILRQIESELREWGIIPHGNIHAGPSTQHVLVSTIQKVANNKEICWQGWDANSVLIFDEAHHIRGDVWREALESFPGIVIGMTATANPGRGQKFAVFDCIIEGPTRRQLIEWGYLAPIEFYQHPHFITGEGQSGYDYNREQTYEKHGDFIFINGAIDYLYNDVFTAHPWARNRRFLWFAVTSTHARNLLAEMQDRGLSVAMVTHETPKEEREQTIQDFQDNKVQYLINVYIYTEGLNVPELAGVVILRPTKMWALYAQMVGRALRASEDKECAIVVDCTDNANRLGHPEDDGPAPSLEGEKDMNGDGVGQVPSVCLIAGCGATIGNRHVCPNCGFRFVYECWRCGLNKTLDRLHRHEEWTRQHWAAGIFMQNRQQVLARTGEDLLRKFDWATNTLPDFPCAADDMAAFIRATGAEDGEAECNTCAVGLLGELEIPFLFLVEEIQGEPGQPNAFVADLPDGGAIALFPALGKRGSWNMTYTAFKYDDREGVFDLPSKRNRRHIVGGIGRKYVTWEAAMSAIAEWLKTHYPAVVIDLED